MATAAVDRPQQSGAWWIFLFQGIAAILLGLMLLTNPGATLVALTTFLGFYLLITGVIAAVVYRKVGLRLLRTFWFNLDIVWAGALVITALATPLL